MNAELIMFTDDLDANRAALADGVVGVRCTSVGPLEADDVGVVRNPVLGLYVSSVEKYENGAKNMYVKRVPGKPAVGFIRVR